MEFFGERSVPVALMSLGIGFASLSIWFRFINPFSWGTPEFIGLLGFGALAIVLGSLERIVYVTRTGVVRSRGGQSDIYRTSATLSALVPSTAKGGDRITIYGARFGPGNQDCALTVDGHLVLFDYWSDSKIMFTVSEKASPAFAAKLHAELAVQVVVEGRPSTNVLPLRII
jgi:hypothetical protein